MTMLYATTAELATYLEPDAETPSPVRLATVLLRHASQLVADATAGSVYPTDTSGYPTDTKLREALRDATCEQASAWSLHGIDPRRGAAGTKLIPTTKGLGPVQVSYGQSADVQAALIALASGTELTDSAWRILRNAGLISNRVGSVGGYERFNIDQRAYDPLTGNFVE